MKPFAYRHTPGGQQQHRQRRTRKPNPFPKGTASYLRSVAATRFARATPTTTGLRGTGSRGRPARKTTPPALTGRKRSAPASRGDRSQRQRYYESGRYDADVDAIVSEARQRLLRRGRPFPARAAAIFDVDDTLLTTHPHKRRQLLARLPTGLRRHVPGNYHPPLDQTAELFRELRDAGVAPLILTGRYERHREETLANLRWAGIDGWREAVFREPHEEGMPAAEYKSARRRAWAKRYRIIANVGDQESDLEGKHNGLAIKLPNQAYSIH